MRAIFETIGYAKVSTSGANARELGLLRGHRWSVDEPGTADRRCQASRAGYAREPCARGSWQDIPVAGEAGYALLKMGVFLAHEGGYISEYDCVVGEKLAYTIERWTLTGEQRVSEQYLLDLEREAFLSLCGQPKTQERMQYMLKNGKALRN